MRVVRPGDRTSLYRGSSGGIRQAGAEIIIKNASVAAYGSFAAQGPQLIEPEGRVEFDFPVAVDPVGMSFEAGMPDITVDSPGAYSVRYRVRTISGTGACVTLAVNGIKIKNSGVNILAAKGETTGGVIIRLNAGDAVSIGVGGHGVMLAAGNAATLELIKIA